MIMRNLYKSLKQISLSLLLFSCSVLVFAQDRVVSGTVTDENGAPMPGVNIVVKGSSNGTASDTDGKYKITAKDADILVFSFIGYQNSEIAVGARSVVNSQMSLDVKTLSELVVVGYSSVEKKDLSSSVAVVDTKEMTKIAASNIGDQLIGRVAGVQVSTSGDPGSSQSIRIRGIGTINNNEPLYVIDGVPVSSEANFNFLNPSDIESMQILKDAAAASIYGSRAANGVIVITTKKGKGKSKLTIDYFTGTQDPARFPSMANPTELLQIRQGLAAGAGQTFNSSLFPKVDGVAVLPDYITRQGGFLAGAPEVDPSKYFINSDPTADASKNYQITAANKEGTNWFKEIFKPASKTSFTVSGSGGSDKGNYYFSANYFEHNGILIKNSYKRYQTRLNSSFNVAKNIRVGENINIAYQTTQAGLGNPSEGSPLKNAYAMPQIISVRDIKGYYGSPAGGNSNAGNPVAQQERAAAGNFGHTMRILGNMYAEVDFLKNFTFKTTFGLDYNNGPSQEYGYRNFEATEINSANTFRQKLFTNTSWVFTNVLNYNKAFGNHTISALIGYESRQSLSEGFEASGGALQFGDDPFYRTLGNVKAGTLAISSYANQNNLISQFANVNYNYADKYYFTATVRRDGSSRFINNKYGTFPSVSAAWRISKESFMADVSFISDLKLRGSYGTTGNNEVGNDYPGYTNYAQGPEKANYDLRGTGNSLVTGFQQETTANPNLKWETTTLANIAFDATFFNKFDVTLELYDRQTKDMIYGVQQPWEAGYIGTIAQNIGSMSNKGIDLQLNYRGKALNDELNFSIGLSGTHYVNKIINLDANGNPKVFGDGTRIGNPSVTSAGNPISQFRGYIADGLWTSQEQINSELFADKGDAKVGRIRFQDINKDGKINDDDIVNTGSPLPKIQLGLNLTASYKNFDVSAYFNGKYGNKNFNFLRYFNDFPAFQANYSKDMLYQAGKTLPVLDANDNYSSRLSSAYIESGSFTRLSNLVIGYSLPASLTQRYGLEKIRLYIQGQNLFTITSYKGLDPDIGVANLTEGFTSRRDLTIGLDNGRYPWARTFLVGANIQF